jgi:hypothetical protein
VPHAETKIVKAEVADGSSPAPVMTPVEDFPRDLLHVLPLDMIPLCTPGLWRAKLIKNSRLRAVVGLFRDRASGSGQIEINDLPKAFLTDWDDTTWPTICGFSTNSPPSAASMSIRCGSSFAT